MTTPVVEFSQAIESLSDRYGPLEHDLNGTLISNDTGFEAIGERLFQSLQQDKRAVSIFIGGAALPSLLPEVPGDTVINLDKNGAVLQLTQIIAELIRTAESPAEVRDRINDPAASRSTPLLRRIQSDAGSLEVTNALLNHEARNYGRYHWSDPQRFTEVKAALEEKSLVSLHADITNDAFGAALSNTFTKYGRAISLMNITNVHAYITDMSFLHDWPFDPGARIIYSDDEDGYVGDWPSIKIADSVNAYLSATAVRP